MLHLFCASPLKIESEMIFTPFCLSEATSSYEYELVNLMDSSTVSNKTQITTDIPAMSFSSDKKSINYQGEIFIFNCPMSVNDADFFTQVIHWLEQDTSTNIVNGKEYISSENGKKIHLFEVERPLKERYEIGGEFRNFNVKSARTWVAIGLIGLKVATAYKYYRGSTILRQLAEEKSRRGAEAELRKEEVVASGRPLIELISPESYQRYMESIGELSKYLEKMYPDLKYLEEEESKKLVEDLTKLTENKGGFIENVKSLYSPLQAMNKIKTALKTAAKSKKENLQELKAESENETQAKRSTVEQVEIDRSDELHVTAGQKEKVYTFFEEEGKKLEEKGYNLIDSGFKNSLSGV